MSVTTPVPLARNPFLDPRAPSLGSVIEALDGGEPHPRRRGEMRSAIRTLARVLGKIPHELPADMSLLNRLIRRALPLAAGVTPERWANAKSLTLAALRASGLSIMPGRRLHPLAPSWAELYARLGDYERVALSRLMRWCSAQGLAPGEVDQDAIERFGEALLNDSFHENPRDAWRRSVREWNRAVRSIEGWPQTLLALPPSREPYVLALEAFPPSFQQDAGMWLDGLAGKAGPDLGPVKPLRPATLAKWQFSIRQLASVLVLSGRDISGITSLADLVTLDAADAILRFLLARSGGKPSAQTDMAARCLTAIARHHVDVAPKVLDGLKRMGLRVKPPAQGMTAKNRAALRQFSGIEAQRRLIGLPAKLFAQLPAKGPVGLRLAQQLQQALAIEILLVAPMRLRNLVSLDFGRHIHQVGRRRSAHWFVSIPGEEVKNGETIELPLPARTVQLLELYRMRLLPLLGPPGGSHLFPGLNGAKATNTLGGQISRRLERELGVRLSAHQFRHLLGYLYLQRHPNGHEVVRAMLGHRDIRTTISFYAGLEGVAAARRYDAVLQELRSPQHHRRAA